MIETTSESKVKKLVQGNGNNIRKSLQANILLIMSELEITCLITFF